MVSSEAVGSGDISLLDALDELPLGQLEDPER
jgi:hypothetical protein